MTGRQDPRPPEYEALSRAGQEAFAEGRPREGLERLEEALAWAEEHGSRELVDHAFLNLSSAGIALGESREPIPRLREILLGSGDPGHRFGAAYNIARALELEKDYQKGLFYARLARDRARQLDEPRWQAGSHNQLGNFLLALSCPDEAMAEYQAALELLGETPGALLGSLLGNMGYCRLLQGRTGEGFRLLFRALRMLRRNGTTDQQVHPHLDLAFGYLEIGRPGRARRHAERALELAKLSEGDPTRIKNALYLLGEAAHLSGEAVAARRHFEELQAFFPDTPRLADFLLTVDIRGLINLRA